MLAAAALSFFLLASAQAWVPSAPRMQRHSLSLSAENRNDVESTTRKDFLTTIAASVAASAVAMPLAARAEDDVTTLPSGVTYKVVKSGSGAKPEIGELAAIRFAAYCNDFKLDDIFDTPEPYYTRVGSGSLIKGVEQTLPLMRTGDRWVLTVPGPLAFGKEGRRASAGKPRIPSDATIIFDVEIIAVPGKEEELIELIGDS